jgi:hypothetical protein
MEVSGQLHASAALLPGKEPLVPIMVSKRKIPNPHRESNPDHPIVQPVASHYTDWAKPTFRMNNKREKKWGQMDKSEMQKNKKWNAHKNDE